MFQDQFLNELRLRWKNLQTQMQKTSTQGLFVSSNVNLYYVSGRVFSGYTYLPAEGDPLFFVRRPVGLSGSGVIYIRKPEEIGSYFQEHGIAFPKTLALETDSISYNEYQRYEAIFHPEAIQNGSALLRSVRNLKTDWEIEQIRRSGKLHTQVYETIPSLYRPGMTDIELSIEIERQSRLAGSLGLFRIFGQSMEIFMGSLLAGDNADNPSPYDFAMGGAGQDPSLPVGGNGTPLKEGMAVMVDMGGNFTGYTTDMSRVFSIGTLSELAYRAHDCSLAIQHEIEHMAKPGTPAKDLYNKALEVATEAGLADYFMGHNQKAGFVGHGIGIEINEGPVLAPRAKDILAPGMVFALEPKFVIPGVGAVGIENSFVVRENGLEKLTLCEEKILNLS